MNLSPRQKLIIEEYQHQIRMTGRANYCSITRAVGLKSNVGSYAKRVVQKWLDGPKSPRLRGTVRECLCCDDHFVSSGKHHRLCDKCRFNGEYAEPYTISPSIHMGAGR